jgi:hypothetical protein
MTPNERRLTNENTALREHLRQLQIEHATATPGSPPPDSTVQSLRTDLANARREVVTKGEAIANAMGRWRGSEPLIEAVARLSQDYHTLWLAEQERRLTPSPRRPEP